MHRLVRNMADCKVTVGKKIIIAVATHKNYAMPLDKMYLPVQAGAALHQSIGFQKDDEGENISLRNNLYCELTVLYWAWKNLKCDYFGLVHYRRHFTLKKKCRSIENVITEDQLLPIIDENVIVLPHKRFYLQSIANHYIRCIKSRKQAHTRQLLLLKSVIQDLKPDYLDAFNRVMTKHSAHMLNMFVMSKKRLDQYCDWLFSILFELERRIQKEQVMFERIMGSFSEFLLDVWLSKENVNVVELDLYEPEKNLFKKLKWALKRKFKE